MKFTKSLQTLVAAITVPRLKMIVIQGSDHKTIHLKQNKSVEFLEVNAPCKFLMSPLMDNLKEIQVKVSTSACPFKTDDGCWSKHIPGFCCTMFELNRARVQKNSSNELKMTSPS